ncbi:S41 family peptidase [Hymenobacter lucidus]|uniref:S41 family peptidase n=1 Tax=Hymenobacter lucidus TaxID=2880930 RepID=A0ABS8AQH2_9BACT|nr:S41 family peptidase [Hymenobacter lucidus]MCB2408465.1 S41 family peptidase [Hymenobacter lucidus]
MTNFRLATLVAALLLPFLGCAQARPQAGIQVSHLVDSIEHSLKTHYVFPDKARLISRRLKSQAKKNAYASLAQDPEKLAVLLQEDIYKAHHDPHMAVEYNPDFARRRQKSAQQSGEEIRQFANWVRENNFMFKKVELLPGNIGYFPFNVFVEQVKEAKPIIASALGFLANSRALIIDLRENSGGEPEMVSQLESYFFKEKTRMNSIVQRANQDTTFYYADPAKTDGITLSMPIYILTSNKTFSAAEDFSYAMQQANRATIVGEVTGGGAHPTMPFSVGQGFVVHIPFARSLNPITNTDWEGTGVLPDVKVEAAQALIKAQELILRERQATAKTAKDKQKMEYLINTLYVNRDLGTLPLDQFDQLAGTYGPLVIYREGNKLLCTFSGNKTELAHISKNLFVLDENAQIEFVKDSKGLYSMARLFIQNGEIFEELRK